MYTFLGSYLTKQEVEDLTVTANRIIKFTLELSRVQPDILKETYQANIDVIAASTQSTIFIINSEGNTVVASGAEDNISLKKEFINGILKGNTVKYTGTLGGLFDTTMLTVGVPMKSGDKVFGGVLMSMPVPEIDELRSTIILRFSIIAAIDFLFVIWFDSITQYCR